MAALRDVVRNLQEELRGGIAWVVFWREGTSWDGKSVYLDDDDLLTKDDRIALMEILQKDAHAVALNSYYSGQVAEDMTVERYVNGKYLDGKQFPGLEGMIHEVLSHLDYDELTHVSEDELTSCGIYLDELDQAAVDQSQDYYEDGHFCPNVAAYQELKAEHPRKVAGVRVGKYVLFYGEDARTVAPALYSKLLEVDIPGMGKTQVAGSNLGWQYVLKNLVDRNIPVVIAEPDTEKGGETPYRVIKEREKVAGDGTGYDIPPECSSFTIYQVKLGQETDKYLFQPYETLQENGLKISPEHYEKVYMAPLSEEQNLEEIYMEFNVMKPDDYRGRSLSISDVVVIHEAGEDTAYYCDLVGFREVPEFLGQEIKIQEREEEELEEL